MIRRHRLAEVASLLADPSRAAMLSALMDGRALPAGQLAREASITASTASAHLARLRASGLVRVQVVGRHRYIRLAGPEVAAALEALGRLVPPRAGGSDALTPEQHAVRTARLCYDHLAGALGVALTTSLVEQRALALDPDGLVLGRRAATALRRLDIDLAALRAGSRPLLRTCIDWTERREHVAGALGATVAAEFLERDWVRRRRGTRALLVTTLGTRELRRRLGLRWG